jgi:hypothetical protein
MFGGEPDDVVARLDRFGFAGRVVVVGRAIEPRLTRPDLVTPLRIRIDDAVPFLLAGPSPRSWRRLSARARPGAAASP